MSVCAVAKLLCSEQDLFIQLSMKRQTRSSPRHVSQELLKRRGRGKQYIWAHYGQDIELFAYQTERIQKQRIRLKYSPREHFQLKHHPARNWNLAEILYDASCPVCRLTSVLAVHCCYCQLWSLVWPMSLNKRARKAAVTVNLPFNSIVQMKLTQLYSTSSPPSSFDSLDTRHWWTGHGK